MGQGKTTTVAVVNRKRTLIDFISIKAKRPPVGKIIHLNRLQAIVCPAR